MKVSTRAIFGCLMALALEASAAESQPHVDPLLLRWQAQVMGLRRDRCALHTLAYSEGDGYSGFMFEPAPGGRMAFFSTARVYAGERMRVEAVGTKDVWFRSQDRRGLRILGVEAEKLLRHVRRGGQVAVRVGKQRSYRRYVSNGGEARAAVAMFEACLATAGATLNASGQMPGSGSMYFTLVSNDDCTLHWFVPLPVFGADGLMLRIRALAGGGDIELSRRPLLNLDALSADSGSDSRFSVDATSLYGGTVEFTDAFRYDITPEQLDGLMRGMVDGGVRDIAIRVGLNPQRMLRLGGESMLAPAAMFSACRNTKFAREQAQ